MQLTNLCALWKYCDLKIPFQKCTLFIILDGWFCGFNRFNYSPGGEGLNLLFPLVISHEMTKMLPLMHMWTCSAPFAKNAWKLLRVTQVTGVPACEPSVLRNGAYKWLLDCDLKCPMIWKYCYVYVIYHMYNLATDLGELMKIMVVCADQQDGILTFRRRNFLLNFSTPSI
jgi:hypothetical protein